MSVYDWHDPWTLLAAQQDAKTARTEQVRTPRSNLPARLYDPEIKEALGLVTKVGDRFPSVSAAREFIKEFRARMVATGAPNIRAMPEGRRVEIVRGLLADMGWVNL